MVTVKSHKYEVIRTRVFCQIISSSDYRAVDIKKYNPPKWLLSVFFLSNISFGRVKETSLGDVSFTNPKLMLV